MLKNRKFFSGHIQPLRGSFPLLPSCPLIVSEVSNIEALRASSCFLIVLLAIHQRSPGCARKLVCGNFLGHIQPLRGSFPLLPVVLRLYRRLVTLKPFRPLAAFDRFGGNPLTKSGCEKVRRPLRSDRSEVVRASGARYSIQLQKSEGL
jgi:hypothetical protein